MKVYFELSDICDIDGILGRVAMYGPRYNERKTPQLCYLFVAQYALASLKAIVKTGIGENFVTFTPPNQHQIYSQMCGLWPEQDIVDLKITFDTIDLDREVRFSELQTVISSVLSRTGKSRQEVAEHAVVSLFMNEIGNAVICLEC